MVHLDTNSDLLFSNVVLSAERIISFSVRHRLHRLYRLEYAEALVNICQLIWKVLPSCLSFQTCFDNSVLFSYLSCLKLVKWFASRCLKDVSVEPMYVFGAGVLSVSVKVSYICLPMGMRGRTQEQ